MRCVLRSFLVLAVSSQLAAASAERLAMPFDCRVEGGEVRLNPLSEQSYRIVGPRTEQTVTTCPDARASGCRTMMVHHFELVCGGATVSWAQVAAGIRGAGANRAWMEDGRLNIVMPARAVQIPDACLASRQSDPRQQRVVLTGDCLPWSKAAFDHLVLPAGYAPVGELGARLMMGGAADELTTGSIDVFALDEAGDAPSVEADITLAKADPEALLEPNARGAYSHALEASLEDEWITVVHSGSEGPVGLPSAEETSAVDLAPSRTLALILAIGSSATIALLLALRLSRSLSMHRFWTARHRTAFDLRIIRNGNPSIANAAAAVRALLEQTDAAAETLHGAGPLREVLQGELVQVRERLMTAERQIAKGEIPHDKSALQFRALVRELERIHRIVDSAAASLPGHTREASRLPRTASEAYEVLGVNAEVSAGVLKKIVDALRMSWHPDHARDDADRALREDRIRQINIAWDLINGKREAA